MTFTLIQYDDGSGPRLAVSEGHLTEDGEKTVLIVGMGEATIHAADIEHLISGLRAAQCHFARQENDA